MTPHKSRLLPDGRVFPPVTPDPPPPPGQEEIDVPTLSFAIKEQGEEADAASAAPENAAEEGPSEPPE
jgi:hypothetical protein